MKKGLKYLSWLPFGISIGALVLYLRYFIMFKADSNIIVTNQIKSTLNQYLIIVFVSLFIGLLFVLFDKLKGLKETQNTFYEDNKNEKIKNSTDDYINTASNSARVLKLQTESNFMKYIKTNKVIKVKVTDPIIGKTLKGKIIDTDEDIEILLLDYDMQFPNLKENVKNPIECPKCKNILDESAFICTNCGIILNNEILNSILSEYKSKEEDKKENNVIKYRKKFNIIRFFINFIVIILCIILIYLVGNKIINERQNNFEKMNITDVENY